MDLLRNHETHINNNMNDQRHHLHEEKKVGKDGIDVMTLLQIVEFKCTIKTMIDQLNPIKSITTTTTTDSSTKMDTQSVNDMNQSLNEILQCLKSIEAKVSSTRCEEIKVNDLVQRKEISPSTSKLDDIKSNNQLDQNHCKEENITREISETSIGENNHNNIEHKVDLSSINSENDQIITNDDVQNPLVGIEALKDALQNMVKCNEQDVLKSCIQMLLLYISNLSTNPKSKQYRKIYTNSKTFIDKVGNVEFGKDVLFAVGFMDEGKSFMEWKIDSEEDIAIDLLKEAASMLKLVKNGEQLPS